MSQAPDLKPVYLIVSEQELLVEQAITRLKDRLGGVADLDFNMQAFDGEKSTSDDIISAANTMPFASDYRLVIVRNVEKLPKDSLEALSAYCADPSATTVLALAGEKLAKNTRLYKAVDKLGGVVARQFDKREVPAMVQQMFEQRGKRISRGCAEEFVAAVGADLRRLTVEVEKTVAYVGDRTEVTSDDVDSVVSTVAPTSIWEFTEALGDRDCRRALMKAADLIGEGESVFGLHAMALRTIRDLIAARSLADRGKGSPGDLARELGRQEWQMKRLARQARGFAGPELSELLRAAASAEAEMKTSRDSRLVLERWIVKVCA